jgi:hypothetical protein
MNYLGQFPVKVNQHFSASPEELNALVNACAFFYEYFSGDDICMSDWKDVARDEYLERYKQLASKFAQI